MDYDFDRVFCKLSKEHDAFLKENDSEYLSLTGDRFFVVEEGDKTWLLKVVDGCIAIPPESEEEHYRHSWRNGLPEVYAYKIASYLKYPIRETKLVLATIQGTEMVNQPFLAYAFVKDHKYIRHTDEDFPSSINNISNMHDVRFRVVFNWLIGSHGDNGRQALIDPKSDKYYAVEAAATLCHHTPYHKHLITHNNDGSDYYRETMMALCDKATQGSSIECITIGTINKPLSPTHEYLNRVSNLQNKDFTKEILSLQSETLEDISFAVSERAKAIRTIFTDKK